MPKLGRGRNGHGQWLARAVRGGSAGILAAIYVTLAAASAASTASAAEVAGAASATPAMAATSAQRAGDAGDAGNIGGDGAAVLPAGSRLDARVALAGGSLAAGTVPAPGGQGTDLLLVVTSGSAAAGRAAFVPPPAGRSGQLRVQPLPLVEEGKLAGLVWLEGDNPRAYAVRTAAWNGAGWSEPRTISPVGPGSQVALSAARLADGSWLLAWSAFDGHFDQIVWSRATSGRGAWTAPQAVTAAQTPSITPAVAAAGDGAVLAFSQLAGDGYRLLTARFADGRFAAPLVATPGGSLYPQLAVSSAGSAGGGAVDVLYRTAAPRGWAAMQLDTAGRPLRQAALPDLPAATAALAALAAIDARRATTAATRPTLAAGDSAAFHWAGGNGGDGADVTRTAEWSAWQAPAAAPDRRILTPIRATAPGDEAATAAAPTAAGAPATATARRAARPLPKASAPPVYVAFGDSITAGYGDTADLGGYPGRLQTILSNDLNSQATVINDGLYGETTGEGVSRIRGDLQAGYTGLLLMEGTNDIDAKVSIDTTIQNLDVMASDAEALGMIAYHATVIPRLPTANTDGTNLITSTLAGAIRELAWERSRPLVDPFEVFWVLTPNAIPDDYTGGIDKLHPNPAGYTLLAQTFASVLTGVDDIPPVTGLVSPYNGAQNVSPNAQIQIDLYDFGTGIDVANTQLLVNGTAIAITPSGDKSKLEYRYQPPSPLVGVVTVGLATQDLASPPNVFNGTVSQFVITGTVFLEGDLNHDGIVDGLDLVIFAYSFGAHRYDPNYNIAADFNGDGIVDGRDLAVLAANFGKRSF
jgi:lysophospholipase L1-like esterase